MSGRATQGKDAGIVTESADGHRFETWIYDHGTPPERPWLLFFPAMGTRARNYKLLAQELRARGYPTALCDLRGHGTSSARASRQCNYGYRHMLMDWEAAVSQIKQRAPQRALYLTGHSLGGQLSLLYAATHVEEVTGVILIGSCSVYWRGFGARSLPFRFMLPMVGPLVRLLGHFPGDTVGFARREGAGVMRDWARQGITGKYLLHGDPTDYEKALAELNLPTLVLEAARDHLAPPDAVTHLIAKLKQASIQRTVFEPIGARRGFEHFDWFKNPLPVVEHITGWLQNTATHT